MMVPLVLQGRAQNGADGVAQDSSTRHASVSMLGTYYADRFVGRRTSSGDVFRQNQYTAAHRSYAFGTYLLVQYPKTELSIVVKVNDRCPRSNILDMTKIAAYSIGIRGSGTVNVTQLDPETGYVLWANQDTTWMTREEYLSFGDKSKVKRISPYPLGNKSDVASAEQRKSPAKLAPTKKTNTSKLITNPPEQKAEELQPSEPEVDTVAVKPVYNGPLYDIELCTVVSQNVANLEVGRLPKELQDKILFEQNRQNREVTIILELAASRSHVVRTQAMIIDLFPEACVIPHQSQ